MFIRCSQLARPMVCAGFAYLDLPETESGDAAKEGTACGELLEKMLTHQVAGDQVASNGVYFDDDMRFYLNPIYEDIMSRAAEPVLCETRIDWTTQSGIVIRGQYDACFVDNEGTLCIEDLKYGWGIIEVEENWQLLGYAIGEVIRRGQVFDNISLKIHQPRPHHEDGTSREWRITYTQLLEYKQRIEDRMMSMVNGNRELTTSDKCKYCMGAAEACPAFNRLFYRALEVTTEFHQDSITDEELSRQLDQIKRAEEVIKIKKDSINELGNQRIKQGRIIPNYVQTKQFGHRQWKDGVSAESLEVMTGVKPVETKLMTPAKAEKAGIPKELVVHLTESKFKGMKLEKKNTTEIGNNIFGTTNPLGGK